MDLQDGVQSLGYFGGRRDLIENAGIANLGFGADDALGERGRSG